MSVRPPTPTRPGCGSPARSPTASSAGASSPSTLPYLPRPHGPLRGAEDDDSVEGEEAPAELAVRILAGDPHPGLVGVGGRMLSGTLPVLPLDADVELGGFGVVVALAGALVVVLLFFLLLVRAGSVRGGGGGGAELVLFEVHDAAEGDSVRGGTGGAGLGGGANLRPHG